jgi:hypothetical protein
MESKKRSNLKRTKKPMKLKGGAVPVGELVKEGINNIIGSTPGNFLNEKYFNEIPYIKENFNKYDKETIKRLKEKEIEKKEKAEIDYKTAYNKFKEDGNKLYNEKEKDKILNEQHYNTDTKAATRANTDRQVLATNIISGFYDLLAKRLAPLLGNTTYFVAQEVSHGTQGGIKVF